MFGKLAISDCLTFETLFTLSSGQPCTAKTMLSFSIRSVKNPRYKCFTHKLLIRSTWFCVGVSKAYKEMLLTDVSCFPPCSSPRVQVGLPLTAAWTLWLGVLERREWVSGVLDTVSSAKNRFSLLIGEKSLIVVLAKELLLLLWNSENMLESICIWSPWYPPVRN